MKTQTKSTVTHRTHVTSDKKRDDGGRELLIELFDDIRSDKRVGKMEVQFGVGGSIIGGETGGILFPPPTPPPPPAAGRFLQAGGTPP